MGIHPLLPECHGINSRNCQEPDVEVDDLWSAARKDSVDGAERTGSGRAFQSTTVLGKKEYL